MAITFRFFHCCKASLCAIEITPKIYLIQNKKFIAKMFTKRSQQAKYLFFCLWRHSARRYDLFLFKIAICSFKNLIYIVYVYIYRWVILIDKSKLLPKYARYKKMVKAKVVEDNGGHLTVLIVLTFRSIFKVIWRSRSFF